MMTTNYLFCEPLIIHRLIDEVPAFREVISTAGLVQMQDDNPAAPSAYVVYVGDAINTSLGATAGNLRQSQFITQRWAVVVCVHITDSRGLGEDVNAEAGVLITKTLQALSGWSPDKNHCTEMTRSAQQLTTFYENGFGYYPFIFEVGIPHKFLGVKP